MIACFALLTFLQIYVLYSYRRKARLMEKLNEERDLNFDSYFLDEE